MFDCFSCIVKWMTINMEDLCLHYAWLFKIFNFFLMIFSLFDAVFVLLFQHLKNFLRCDFGNLIIFYSRNEMGQLGLRPLEWNSDAAVMTTETTKKFNQMIAGIDTPLLCNGRSNDFGKEWAHFSSICIWIFF